MSVEISPQELSFHRPFTVEVVESLKIKNTHNQPIAFKVKTTAPKQYCVRPNSGRVEPNREVEVQVILQAMKQEPPPNTKCKDKFLVQSVAITPDKDFTNLASIWDTIDKASVQEKKIRVNFLDVEVSSNDTGIATPSKSLPANGDDATPDVGLPAFSSPKEHGEFKPPIENSPSVLAASAAVATTVNSEPSREELKQQLIEAENLIAKLKQDNGGLRQRKTTTAEEKSNITLVTRDTRPHATEGVPVHITAALCLVSFLLAYTFF
ncbi:PapD-like protein [Xylaria nigripes]|nr:PapD-like protein [Xylaria nigripes]